MAIQATISFRTKSCRMSLVLLLLWVRRLSMEATDGRRPQDKVPGWLWQREFICSSMRSAVWSASSWLASTGPMDTSSRTKLAANWCSEPRNTMPCSPAVRRHQSGKSRPACAGLRLSAMTCRDKLSSPAKVKAKVDLPRATFRTHQRRSLQRIKGNPD